MFTGIIEEIGTVKDGQPNEMIISAAVVLNDLKVSDSICVNGACLTVTQRDKKSFSAQLVPETLRRTNLGALNTGDCVNLERPIAVGGRYGGHIVQGHVDATGTIESITSQGDALVMKIQSPGSVARYIVEKGFIAIDGTSLTIVDCDNDSFVVSIIPYTRDNTNLGTRKVGDFVNLEVDIIAKYVESLSVGPQTPFNITSNP